MKISVNWCFLDPKIRSLQKQKQGGNGISKAQKLPEDSKCQVFSFTVPENSKVGPNWRSNRRDPLGFSNTHSVAKHRKFKRGPLEKKIKKITIPKQN